MPLPAPVAPARVEAVETGAAILPLCVPAKAVARTVMRAAANAAEAAIAGPAPSAAGTAADAVVAGPAPSSAGTAEAWTAVVVPPLVAAEMEVKARADQALRG